MQQLLHWRLPTPAVLVCCALMLAACGTPIATRPGAGIDFSTRTIQIVVTTGHVADVVRNVGGNRVAVTALMGPGVDPHLYKASASDVMTIQLSKRCWWPPF